jgi:hypothetical protein
MSLQGDIELDSPLDPAFVNFLLAEFPLDVQGPLGLKHWRRTARNAKWIHQNESRTDLEVMIYFAYLADSQKEFLGKDPHHGRRAAQLAHRVHGEYGFNLSPMRLKILCDALEGHNQKREPKNLTEAACWDAVRLDTLHHGKHIMPKYIHLEASRVLIPKVTERYPDV